MSFGLYHAARIACLLAGLIKIELSNLDSQTLSSKGECQMKMQNKISNWCLVLFFLWYGLGAFVPSLMAAPVTYIGALLALGVAVFTFLGM
jgi:VIT1/CCC1 family predicted Fe2+/Mn2+ transporter